MFLWFPARSCPCAYVDAKRAVPRAGAGVEDKVVHILSDTLDVFLASDATRSPGAGLETHTQRGERSSGDGTHEMTWQEYFQVTGLSSVYLEGVPVYPTAVAPRGTGALRGAADTDVRVAAAALDGLSCEHESETGVVTGVEVAWRFPCVYRRAPRYEGLAKPLSVMKGLLKTSALMNKECGDIARQTKELARGRGEGGGREGSKWYVAKYEWFASEAREVLLRLGNDVGVHEAASAHERGVILHLTRYCGCEPVRLPFMDDAVDSHSSTHSRAANMGPVCSLYLLEPISVVARIFEHAFTLRHQCVCAQVP